MAMTAWSAKVWSRAICRSVKSPAWARVTRMVPIGCPSRSSGHCEPASPSPGYGDIGVIVGVVHDIGKVCDFAAQYRAAGQLPTAWSHGIHPVDGGHRLGRVVVDGPDVDQLTVEHVDVPE